MGEGFSGVWPAVWVGNRFLGGMEVGARMAVGYMEATGGLEWEGVASG